MTPATIASGDAARQRPGEQKGRISRQRERREQRQVVDAGRDSCRPRTAVPARCRGAASHPNMPACRAPGRRCSRRRAPRGFVPDGVRHPCQPPHAEVRIGMVGDRAGKASHLRIGDHHGERNERQRDRDVRPQCGSGVMGFRADPIFSRQHVPYNRSPKSPSPGTMNFCRLRPLSTTGV